MFNEYDWVSLKRDIVDVHDGTGKVVTVVAKSTGVVLIVYSAEYGFEPTDPLQYEVEFLNDDGDTLGLLTMSEADLEPA